jgi:hypothetical protein
MTSPTHFDTFLGMLREMATVDQGPGTLRLSAYDGVPLDPPIELAIDHASLERYVAAAGRDAQEAFGAATPPDRAALQLLSVHVEETVLSRKPGHRTLVLGSHGLAWER